MTDTLTDEELDRIDREWACRDQYVVMGGATDMLQRVIDALRDARAERDALRAEVESLRERMNVILHAGPSTALAVEVFDRASRLEAEVERLRNEAGTTKRRPGCQCQWEEGDSPCPVHPNPEDESPPEPER